MNLEKGRETAGYLKTELLAMTLTEHFRDFVSTLQQFQAFNSHLWIFQVN